MTVVPDEWTLYTPHDIAGLAKDALVIGPFGSNLKTSDYRDEGVPLVFVKDIRAEDFSRPRAYVSTTKAVELRAHQVLPGDILITKMGEPPGDVALYDSDVPGVITADCIRLRPTSGFDRKYLVHSLRTPSARKQIEAITTGAAQKKVSLDRFRTRLHIAAPTVVEQKRIAAVLDHVDTLRAKCREAIALLDDLAQSIFLEMFGDPAGNPMKWPLRSLRSVSSVFSDGPFGSNLKSAHYQESGIRVVRLQNIGVGEFVDRDQAYVSVDHFQSLKRHSCLPGDILIGTLGEPNLRACIQPEWLELALNKADCVQMRVDQGVADSVFMCALLNQPGTEKLAQSMTVGQTRLRISMGRLRDLEVPFPPLASQSMFRTATESVERSKAQYRTQLASLDELFTSLQHRAFSGTLWDHEATGDAV
ncbi:restriction endonuclease subunit S [Streptomyces sp. NPDC021098]|uniref:restriction endonuclease subunit S n=1 Tax=unclassified Streptomyces TaxID=2593676 RepID=UPI0037A46548